MREPAPKRGFGERFRPVETRVSVFDEWEPQPLDVGRLCGVGLFGLGGRCQKALARARTRRRARAVRYPPPMMMYTTSTTSSTPSTATT